MIGAEQSVGATSLSLGAARESVQRAKSEGLGLLLALQRSCLISQETLGDAASECSYRSGQLGREHIVPIWKRGGAHRTAFAVGQLHPTNE